MFIKIGKMKQYLNLKKKPEIKKKEKEKKIKLKEDY